MTRKPDGWVDQFWKVEREEQYARIWKEPQPTPYNMFPVCLVPPALLDWVEEVEKYLKVTLYNCTLNGFEMLASEEKALFDKLREVRG